MSDEEDQIPEGVQGPLSPLDYVVQNLQCRLGNPRNRCFANSAFRLLGGKFHGGPKSVEQNSFSGERSVGQ